MADDKKLDENTFKMLEPTFQAMSSDEFKALKTLEAGFREKHGDGPWTFILRNCIGTIDARNEEIAKLRAENTRLKNELAGKPKKPRKPVFDKTNTLAAYWSHEERCLEVWHPTHKSDAAMMFCYFSGGGVWEPNDHLKPLYERKEVPLVTELERRGYDVTTLRFSVKKKT